MELFPQVLTSYRDEFLVLVVAVELIWLLFLNMFSFNFIQMPNKSLRFRKVQVRCWMLFFRMHGCCITLTKMKSMSLCLFQLAIFLKHSKEGRSASNHEGIQNVPSDVCYEVAHYQVPSKKQGMCKVCKNNFRCRCVKCKASLYDICFEIFHGS